MATPWKTLDSEDTPHGLLELRRRGEHDFLIAIAGRVLMNSHANRSEVALAESVCRALEGRPAPRVLIGGLGMGCTLRAAARGLPPDAVIEVSELTPAVARWCAGPLASVNESALDDPRVQIRIGDVSRAIAERADDRSKPRLDAILLDLYEGPHAGTNPKRDPFYGRRALDATRRALATGGVFAIWSEVPDESFEKRVAAAGFELERIRSGKGGRRHAVYLARLKSPKRRASGGSRRGPS
ncbi:MAG: spermidine synthase [bacterium]|nr:spermidine synthase [bacterium]